MSAIMDYYYVSGSPPCRSVAMTAKTLGLELNKKLLNLQAGDHLTPEYLKLNPQHTVPTLVDNGFALWESRAIMIYLVEKYARTDSLYPKNPQLRALINQRLQFDLGTLSVSYAEYYYPQWLRQQPGDPEKLKKLEAALDLLNTFLEDRVFAVGKYLTLADIALLASVSTLDMAGLDLSKYTNILNWYENVKQVTPGWPESYEEIVEAKKKFGLK